MTAGSRPASPLSRSSQTGGRSAAVVPMKLILETVSDRLDVTVESIRAYNRRKWVTRARKIAMYLTRDLTDHSLVEVGEFFDRSHSAVLGAVYSVLGNQDLFQLAVSIAQDVRRLADQAD